MTDQFNLRLLWAWAHVTFLFSLINTTANVTILSIAWGMFIVMIGGFAGFHRYFTHRSYRTDKYTEIVMFWLGIIMGLGRPIAIIFFHRWHHAHSDLEDDVHSPKYLSWWQILFGFYKMPNLNKKYIKDLLKDKKIKFAQRHFFKIHILLNISLLIVNPILPGLNLAPITLYALYSGLIINYFSHINGKSNNNFLLAALTLGEGWHKNHHDDGSRYSNQVKWYQFDPTGWTIKYFLKRS